VLEERTKTALIQEFYLSRSFTISKSVFVVISSFTWLESLLVSSLIILAETNNGDRVLFYFGTPAFLIFLSVNISVNKNR
jgi:hypothetical protein